MPMRRSLLLSLVLLSMLGTPLLGCEGAAPAAPDEGRTPGLVPLAADGGPGCGLTPEAGCPCDGDAPIDCYLDPIPGTDGTLTCNHGTQYCRDGVWTGCESIRAFVITPSPSALITGPDTCNLCDPRCFSSRDVPNAGDLGTGNSSGVSYDATAGGITITSTSSGGTTLTDSDMDGVPDVADECTGAGFYRQPDGTCATGAIYHTLAFGSGATSGLDITTQIRSADVYFLFDTTGSMGDELANLQSGMTSGTYLPSCTDATLSNAGIIGAIRCTIPDSWFGVGAFDDYPVSPYGDAAYGDVVYSNRLDIQSTVSAAQTAVNGLEIHYGDDGPESNTQALYALSTGAGLGSWLSARSGCGAGTFGYPCFRNGAIPIVVHITDAPFHNGPSGANPYCLTRTDRSISAVTAITSSQARRSAPLDVGDVTNVYVRYTGQVLPFQTLSGSSLTFPGRTNDWTFSLFGGSPGPQGNDATFRFSVSTGQQVRISTIGSRVDTAVFVRRVAPTTSGWAYVNDTSGRQEEVTWSLSAGTYEVVVDSWTVTASCTRDSDCSTGQSCTSWGTGGSRVRRCTFGGTDFQLTVGFPYSCANTGIAFPDVTNAMATRNVRVITVQTCGDSSDLYCQEGEAHARALANATSSIDGSGNPYVFTAAADGTGLSSQIVDAVVRLANFSRMNVTARAVGDTQGFTQLPIAAVTWGPGGGCTGITGGTTFTQCLPGTPVRFNVQFRNDVVMPTTTPQVFSFFIEVVGDGTVVLSRTPVRIVVPAVAAGFAGSGRYWRDYDTTLRCSLTERPRWGNLTWVAAVPTGTQIRFELRASDSLASLPTATPIANITVPSATSPRDIAAALRGAGLPDGLRYLRVSAVLLANPTRTLSPTLTEFATSYTCVPAE